MLISSFALFSVLPCLVNAAPRKPTSFLAISPSITEPTNYTVWHLGKNGVVKWETDDIPIEAQDYVVKIDLGHPDNDSEHLDTKNPLAVGIPIMQGMATFTVPINIPEGDGYAVALIGTSGNLSPLFSIRAS